MSYTTPSMNLLGITIGTDSGLTIEQNYNTNMGVIDVHDHSASGGVAIQPSGINITSSLSFNSNDAIALRTSRYTAQASPIAASGLDLACVYVAGADLYYNDTAGNQVQITTGGAVNATSSGISSGTATASFVAGALVVNAAATTPANIQGASILLGNNSAGSHFVTLSPKSSLASNYTITLPDTTQAANTFLGMDGSGNIYGYAPQFQGLNGSNIAPLSLTASNLANATITGAKIAASTITNTNILAGTINGSLMATNVNLPGSAVQENGKNVVVSNTNDTKSLSVIRGVINADGTTASGTGFSSSLSSTGIYGINFTTPFGDIPAVTITAVNSVSPVIGQVATGLLSANGFTAGLRNQTATLVNSIFCFTAIGQRA